ncbi:MAG: hypothetical protein R3258_02220 [Acidimicrobiia bacterium]|nr:hypothetical protein [Acidimicrobiia bacterium]
MSQMTLAEMDWADKPVGRATRISLAVFGMICAFALLILAGSVASGAWILVVGGAVLAATSVRAAWLPSRGRLLAVMANLAAIPLLGQLI